MPLTGLEPEVLKCKTHLSLWLLHWHDTKLRFRNNDMVAPATEDNENQLLHEAQGMETIGETVMARMMRQMSEAVPNYVDTC